MGQESKKTALLSVYNKAGIASFARQLLDLNFELLASGGTAEALRKEGVAVGDIAELIGGGAILGHRVVTLSREIYAGLLAQDTKEDASELTKLQLPRIDLVCVDLYPLEEEVLKAGATTASVIEKTDIGGPTLLRAAAKGRRIVICDPSDRQKVIDWLKEGEPGKEEFLSALAAKAEFTGANYALVSAQYHSKGAYNGFLGHQILECKYGENRWQMPAGLWVNESARNADALSLAEFKLVAGMAPSFNNLCDLNRLLETLTHIASAYDLNTKAVPYVAVGVKHGNASGAAVGRDKKQILEKMLEGDLRAIFGGSLMVNFEIDKTLAEIVLNHKTEGTRRLLDGIAAPSFAPSAIEMLKRKGDKCRFFANLALASLSKDALDRARRFRYVRGGFLAQPNYTFVLDLKHPQIEIGGKLTVQQEQDLLLAWAVGSTSNSNTITLVKNGQLIGNGVGQQDRVGGCTLAVKRATEAGHNTQGAVAYSDSFFPFVDGLEVLAKAGVNAIFATSGSVRDGGIKKFCSDQGITLITLPDSLARGFFGH